MNNVIGDNTKRWDANAKVTGQAPYTGDMYDKNILHGKTMRANITHGYVKDYDISEALKIEGVIKIILPEDLPNHKFSTAGHPLSLDPSHKDVEDRNLLTRHIRQHGDEIAAVVAESELICLKAIEKIKVTYEELPFYLTPEQSLKEDAIEIHKGSKNIIAKTEIKTGDVDEALKYSDYILEDFYETSIVQHCHLENQIAYAYKDVDGRYTIVSSTQIPHICRRILGQAFNMPFGMFRVKKPFIGGGFGNKQDVTIEPIAVAMSMACGGRAVLVSLSREESMAYTRTRHSISYKIKAGISKDGTIKALDIDCTSNNGAYASHGHAIASKGGGFLYSLYKLENYRYKAKTVYTNVAAAGAMRGYGIPQVMFAMESFVDKICKQLNLDPIQFRLKNFVDEGHYNIFTRTTQFTNKVADCITEGKEIFKWDEKQKDAQNYKTGDFRRGLGVAAFSYGSCVYPFGLEIAGCRLILNQDASIKCMVGATEIGQGSDTVFAQMVAETVGISPYKVYMDYMTDTDIAPFDTGSYASRQNYVTGLAVKKAAEMLKDKIYDAIKTFYDLDKHYIDIVDGKIVYKHNNKFVDDLSNLTLKTYYDVQKAKVITAESSINCHNNSYPMGATFAYVEVDIKTGKTKILDILNVHDSGKIINPLLATGQVEGGMFMGIGYALSEVLKYDPKTGAVLNNNLLDYKFPTIMDTPILNSHFVEPFDPLGAYGNKSLGEPPACSPAPAIRNAVFDATGAEINSLPLNGEKVFFALQNN